MDRIAVQWEHVTHCLACAAAALPVTDRHCKGRVSAPILSNSCGQDVDKPLPGQVTRVLQRLGTGDRDAVADLLPLVYDELHALAEGQMRGERPGHTLQPTALLNAASWRNKVPQS